MDTDQIRSAVKAVKEHLSAHPESAVGNDSFAHAKLQGGLVTVVHGPSGQCVTTDMPQALGGGSSAPGPGWYFRAGVASCTATMIALRAAELDVPLDRLEVRVESISNDCGLVGIGDGIPAGPLHATIKVEISSAATEPSALEDIVRWSIAHSPMADALIRAVPLDSAILVT